MPRALGKTLISRLHCTTHLGGVKLAQLCRSHFKIPHLQDLSNQAALRCMACTQVNAKQGPKPNPGHRLWGGSPGERWEVEFTEIKPHWAGYKYLLVLIDTFSGWTEAFATKNETATMVVRLLLNEIFPPHGLPLAIGSDNGPAFTWTIAQLVSKALNIQWKLHCAYRPQSSGQVECMNHTLKGVLTKLILETGENWVKLLPLALLRVRCTSYRAGFSPFEIVYGRAPPILPKLRDTHLAEISQANLLQYFSLLQQVRDIIQPLVRGAHSNPVPDWSDLVYVKKFQRKGFTLAWKGPHTVILTTPTALKSLSAPTKNNATCRSWEQDTLTWLQDADTQEAGLDVGVLEVQKKDSRALPFTSVLEITLTLAVEILTSFSALTGHV
ncbi:uncharacterized protein K02A2.6-like isoform X1 [Papio anubis]|uniref:uncharacterized protein K02A2.6-like isoform X1 n=1 Tax=Papio anubis TaxID=9555 RepID=UPI0012ADB70F|nr:uncharacterized protein K02A2.6-like isoform X1 [Papio anubis]